jgi:F-type H+-transporting ATPase subunit a
MKYNWIIILLLFAGTFSAFAEEEKTGLNVRELILDHISDSYEWHIATWGEHHISIPLPVIVKGQNSGWHIFSSARYIA